MDTWLRKLGTVVAKWEVLFTKSAIYSRVDRLFVAQQLIAVCLLPIAIVLWETANHTAYTGPALGLSVLAVLGFGYSAPRSRRSVDAASYTWILPTVAFLLIFADELRKFGITAAIAAFFSMTIGDDDRLATLFFTAPACSAIIYSLGASLKRALGRQS